MDLIREHLIYKDVPLTICMGQLKPCEHYEVIRCLLATRTNDVSICTHDATNDYINQLLKKLDVQFIQCFRLNQEGNFLPPTLSVEGNGSS
jgi:hypothetical protein